MSYAVPAPTAAEPRRPVTVTLAALLLIVMAVAGVGYAVATIAVVPGVVSRFRAGTRAVTPDEVDGVVGLLWLGAGVAVALAVLLFGLYTLLALSLRRGSNTARICTWVVCGLGLLAGCASVGTVLVQRGSSGAGRGDDAFATFGSVAGPLSDAYPDGWIPLNVVLAVAQMLGYLVVAGLLVAAPGYFFGRGAPSAAPTAAPGPYGAYGALPGMPGLYNTPGQPVPGQPVPGQPLPGQPLPGQPLPGQPLPAPPMYGAPYGGAPAYGSPYGQYPPPIDPATAQAQQMWSQQPGQQGTGQPAPGQHGTGQHGTGQQGTGQQGASEAARSDGDDQFWARPPA